MIRVLSFVFALWGSLGQAQDLSGLARLDPEASGVVDTINGVELTLYLSQAVPFRVFNVDGPERLVIDFREVAFGAADPVALDQAEGVEALRFGTMGPGWSRMVLDLAGPLALDTAGLEVSEVDGTAVLTVRLQYVSPELFSAVAGVLPGQGWGDDALPDVTVAAPEPEEESLVVVVIDPGHGGIDPGAERGGLVEAEMMLILAQELADAINRSGTMRAVLTRTADVFVPLQTRLTIARAAGADVFVSLHADALEFDQASGVSVYTLAEDGRDAATARMAERHEQGDLLAGLDLTGQDDRVATVLMDLARRETAPQSDRLADSMVGVMQQAGVHLNSRPRREGELVVLSAADFPSVLIEAGFLSNAGDRARLSDSATRADMIDALVSALARWSADEAVRADLVRQ